jgi:glycosyltransferase involved in cell wall biosynthesis
VTELSVVIPCYNAAPFLDEAISSVFAQTRSPSEVIIVDDGSTDGTAEIAERRGVRVIRLERNVGAAAARNAGLRAARGDLVAWLDADDIWKPEHLAIVVPLLERFPAAVLAFSLVETFGGESSVWPTLLPAGAPVNAEAACLRRCILPQNAVVVRRAEVLAAGGYDERLRLAEDYDLWLRLSREYSFVCTHLVTCNWRCHANQQSRGNAESYWAAEYESRRRYRIAVVAAGTPEVVANLDEAMRDVWKEHVAVAWHGRQTRHFDFHLSMAPLVPGAEAFVSRYRWRKLLLPAARLLDALRKPVNAASRRLRRRMTA